VALGAVLGRLLAQTRPQHVSIGRYQIEKQLGQGAFAVVYRAFDPMTNRHVALKIIRPTRHRNLEKIQARLHREASALARLQHPNVVRVHDTGQTFIDAEGSEGVYLVMELVEGRTLLRWAKQVRPSWRELVSTYLVAGRAIAAAHEVGIIHRDFKPSNVMISDAGVVKVLDFGMARSLGDTDTDTDSSGWAQAAVTAVTGALQLDADLTLSGEMVGTPRFMAPEQHDGSATTHAADQYAFCVSVYEALYGTSPFRANTVDGLHEAKARGIHRQAPNRSVPSALYRVLRRGMHPQPTLRFVDMNALLDAIERAMKPRRRLLSLVAAVSAVVAAGLAVGVTAAIG
jgi:serine/threonine protein kinase